MEHEFAKLLNEFLINEESYIKRIQEDAFTKKNFKFFMSALIHSVYQNDEDNFLKLWCFLIVNPFYNIVNNRIDSLVITASSSSYSGTYPHLHAHAPSPDPYHPP